MLMLNFWVAINSGVWNDKISCAVCPDFTEKLQTFVVASSKVVYHAKPASLTGLDSPDGVHSDSKKASLRFAIM